MVAANILAPRCVDAQVEVAFAEWECLVDGSKGPADVEAHSYRARLTPRHRALCGAFVCGESAKDWTL